MKARYLLLVMFSAFIMEAREITILSTQVDDNPFTRFVAGAGPQLQDGIGCNELNTTECSASAGFKKDEKKQDKISSFLTVYDVSQLTAPMLIGLLSGLFGHKWYWMLLGAGGSAASSYIGRRIMQENFNTGFAHPFTLNTQVAFCHLIGLGVGSVIRSMALSSLACAFKCASVLANSKK